MELIASSDGGRGYAAAMICLPDGQDLLALARRSYRVGWSPHWTPAMSEMAGIVALLDMALADLDAAPEWQTLTCYFDNIPVTEAVVDGSVSAQYLIDAGRSHWVPLWRCIMERKDALHLRGKEVVFWIPDQGRNSRIIEHADAMVRRMQRGQEEPTHSMPSDLHIAMDDALNDVSRSRREDRDLRRRL